MKDRNLGIPLFKVAIRFEPDIVTARQKTRLIARLLGFDGQDQARLATAASELVRNVFQYAGSGFIDFFLSENTPQTFFIRVTDSGPGIAALEQILGGVYVSKSGMGVGLMGSKKLMDHFEIETAPGQGTMVLIGKNFPAQARRVDRENLGKIIDQLISKQNESPFEEIQSQNRDLLSALEEVRAAQDELASLNRELAETNRGVMALYAELDEKAASLQRANEVKTSFLSNMTHEFRTPLSSVISLTRLLLNKIDGELTPEQERQVNYIRQSSEGLLELVNDLLDLAKVEAGKVSINAAEFGVDDVLGGLRGMFRPILNANSAVEFNIERPSGAFWMSTDQAKLSQILRNLISNAIKFTERGSITLTAGIESEGQVHFSLRDTGVGIESRFIETIFEDFSQVDSPLQKKQKGTGLGLPLSRKLARLLGGDLWAESTVGEGSVFHVRLPQVYAGTGEGVLIPHSGDAASSPMPTPSERFRILLVDDDEPSRYVLKNLVSLEIDAEFMEARDGRIGLDRIRQWRPDLVFLDLSMPDIDGFEMLRILESDGTLKDLPVIVNTARKLNPAELETLDRLAKAVLSKDRLDEKRATSELKESLRRAGFDHRNW